MTNMDDAAGGALDFCNADTAFMDPMAGATRKGQVAASRQSAVFIDEEALLRDRRGLSTDARHLDLAPSARVALFRLSALEHRIVVIARRSTMPSESVAAHLNARELALRELLAGFGATLSAVAWCMPKATALGIGELIHGRTPTDAMEVAARRFGLDLARCWVIARNADFLDSGICVGASVVAVGDTPPDAAYAGAARDLGAAVRFVDDATRLSEAAPPLLQAA